MHRELGVFDPRRQNITGWFKRFEFFSDLLGWSVEQRVDALAHLLENGLDRVVCGMEPEYELIKKKVVDLVEKLLSEDFSTNLPREFNLVERTYWYGCGKTYNRLKTFLYSIPSFPISDIDRNYYKNWNEDFKEFILPLEKLWQSNPKE